MTPVIALLIGDRLFYVTGIVNFPVLMWIKIVNETLGKSLTALQQMCQK